MTLRCDWCGDEMGREDEKGRYGHSLEFKAIDGLGLSGGVNLVDGAPKTRVLSLHFHALCQRAVSQAVFELVREHEYEDGELDRFDDPAVGPSSAEASGGDDPPDKWAIERERTAFWKKMPWADRERLALEILGEDRLTVNELTERLSAKVFALGGPELHDSKTRPLLKRMLERRELQRVPETFRKSRIRYRYYRLTELEGPIKDLNDALGES